MIAITLRAALYATGFFLLWGWVALQAHRLDPQLGFGLPSWARVPGIILMIVGAAIALTCAATFVIRGRGTPAPFDPPTQFVAVGPYRYVRNPMYVGGLLTLYGFGLVFHSVSIVIMTTLLAGFVHLMVVYFEEPQLHRRFGDSYARYVSTVNRWLPRLR
jgi:protein-S-isoprenylcysteine O-methyltransferase Ste14